MEEGHLSAEEFFDRFLAVRLTADEITAKAF
jgi:hypothetical protein